MESELPDHKANLTAFLFCRDVIIEARGGISPFRLIDGADVEVNVDPATPGLLTLWQPVSLNVFIGIACYGMPDHEHSLTLSVFRPDGELIGKAPTRATPGGYTPASYRNIDLQLQGHLKGDFRFELEIDGEKRATAFFTLTHIDNTPPATSDPSAPS